jgi:hypothetical protein
MCPFLGDACPPRDLTGTPHQRACMWR